MYLLVQNNTVIVFLTGNTRPLRNLWDNFLLLNRKQATFETSSSYSKENWGRAGRKQARECHHWAKHKPMGFTCGFGEKEGWIHSFLYWLRKLNSATVKDAYTLPHRDDTLDALTGISSARFTMAPMFHSPWRCHCLWCILWYNAGQPESCISMFSYS